MVPTFLLLLFLARVSSEDMPLSNDDITNNTQLSCDEVMEDEELQETMRAGVSEFWPGAVVPYITSANFREKDHRALKSAIEQYHKQTCIRFVARTNEKAFVNISILDQPDLCGRAQTCHTGKPRWLHLHPKYCVVKSLIIHELGHSLCLFHEQRRPDRDHYLEYFECNNPAKIEKVKRRTSNTGHLYDYWSHMHFSCGGCTGKPTMKRVSKCSNRGEDLGILETDKLNAFYNCGGCRRHRWFRSDTLSREEQSALVNFATQEGDSGPIYMCRGYVDGTLVIGTYLPAEKRCMAADNFKVVWVTGPTQLFALSGASFGFASASDSQLGYKLYTPVDSSKKPEYILAGRDYQNQNYYAAVASWAEKDGKKQTWLGYVDNKVNHWGHFPTTNSENELGLIFSPNVGAIFFIIGCKEG